MLKHAQHTRSGTSALRFQPRGFGDKIKEAAKQAAEAAKKAAREAEKAAKKAAKAAEAAAKEAAKAAEKAKEEAAKAAQEAAEASLAPVYYSATTGKKKSNAKSFYWPKQVTRDIRLAQYPWSTVDWRHP